MRLICEIIGGAILALMLLGAIGIIDCNIYIGPPGGAKKWHADRAK